MKEIIKKNTILPILLLLAGLTIYTLAAPALPVTSQVSEGTQGERIEVVEEIKIQAQSNNVASNPNLKEGSACSDENLEEAQGELFTEIPMAKTIPCDAVDCNNLAAAKMHKDNYKKLETAKTLSCDK